MSFPTHSSSCSSLLFNAAICKFASLAEVAPPSAEGARSFQSCTLAWLVARGVPGERSISSFTDCDERKDGGGEEGMEGTEGTTELGNAVL